jgi:hypothetical protein
MRGFAPRVELVNQSGEHIRVVPSPLAAALVEAGIAEVASSNGRVRSIRLTECADTHAERIGEATVPTGVPSVRFSRRVRSDDLAVTWWEHHPRSLYPQAE